MFGELVIGYLFFGGAGAGALVVLAARECILAVRRRSVARALRAPILLSARFFERQRIADAVAGAWQPESSAAWMASLVFLVAGAAFLIADVGRPDRIAALVLSPSPSVVTVGAYALGLSIALTSVFAAGCMSVRMRLSSVVRPALAVAGIVSGSVTAAYTGVLLCGMTSVLFWRSPLLPALFLVSSLSCGAALVALARALPPRKTQSSSSMVRFDKVVLAAEAACLSAYLVWALLDEGAVASASALMFGALGLPFWVGVVACGLIVPFTFEVADVCGRSRVFAFSATFAVLVGGFALRWCIVEAAAFDVTQIPDALYGMAIRGGL